MVLIRWSRSDDDFELFECIFFDVWLFAYRFMEVVYIWYEKSYSIERCIYIDGIGANWGVER